MDRLHLGVRIQSTLSGLATNLIPRVDSDEYASNPNCRRNPDSCSMRPRSHPHSISPATADAKNWPDGVVTFTATGVMNPVWCIGAPSGFCSGNIASPAMIDNSGHAWCIQGQSGTVTVLAGTGVRVGLPDTGKQLTNFGTAKLTCP